MSMSLNISAVTDAFGAWLLSGGVSIVIILIGAVIVHRVLLVVSERSIRRIVIRDASMSSEDEQRREETLVRIVHSSVHVVIIVVVVTMILSSLGIEIGPLVAAAGIVGLAFGFGGQYLIRDVISGLFIIIENQYRVGDSVSLNDISGTVEDITLRMTTLRDLDGIVHHVPNGSIAHVANKGKDFSRVNMNIGVSYSADLEHVERVINQVGAELDSDPVFGDLIREAPVFLRVDNFGDSSVDVKILGTVEPQKQWQVAGELRKRLKVAFDREGIEIPFPQMVVHKASNES